MKKAYLILTMFLFASSPIFALYLSVKNKTGRDMYVALPDDGSASNRTNAKYLKNGGMVSFSTTLTKKIRGPVRFAFVKDIEKRTAKGKRYTMYETPAGAYFFPFTYTGSTARRLEIKEDYADKKGRHYKIRKVPASKAWILAKPGKWKKLNEWKVSDKDW